jgi:hypothetical protein
MRKASSEAENVINEVTKHRLIRGRASRHERNVRPMRSTGSADDATFR